MFNASNMNIFDCTSHNVEKVLIKTNKSDDDMSPLSDENGDPIPFYTTYVEFHFDNKTSMRIALFKDESPVEIEIKKETNQ
tara:strand:- start:1306 stop:1548 length:243 start_codon:yes stop_codon:yes gene_type:complete